MEVKMETKSRYQVIADLEEKKRELIRERDGFDTAIAEQEVKIKAIERQIEDIDVQKEDFAMQQENAKLDLAKQKTDFDFKIRNTASIFNRNLEDAKRKLDQVQSTKDEKAKTIAELIEGVDKSLDRFEKLQTSK